VVHYIFRLRSHVSFPSQNWLLGHVGTLVYVCWDYVSQWRETQVLSIFPISPSPVDPRNCNHIVLRQVSISTHKDAYRAGILSDFHTQPTNMFRLVVAFLTVILTGVSVYYYLFVVPDIGLVTIGDRTLGVNSVERNVYYWTLVLLKCPLISLIKDPSHSKFFQLPKRCQRGDLVERFSTRIDNR